jgi:hypothetical protein
MRIRILPITLTSGLGLGRVKTLWLAGEGCRLCVRHGSAWRFVTVARKAPALAARLGLHCRDQPSRPHDVHGAG